MSDMDRRDAVKALAMLPFALSWDLTAPQIERASRLFEVAQNPKAAPYVPKFFDRHEWQTVRRKVWEVL